MSVQAALYVIAVILLVIAALPLPTASSNGLAPARPKP